MTIFSLKTSLQTQNPNAIFIGVQSRSKLWMSFYCVGLAFSGKQAENSSMIHRGVSRRIQKDQKMRQSGKSMEEIAECLEMDLSEIEKLSEKLERNVSFMVE